MSLVRFDFQKLIVGLDLDIEDIIDIFFNLLNKDTQLMNGGVPWRGGQEKNALSLQVFVEALTKLGVVILDAFASTCAHLFNYWIFIGFDLTTFDY